MKITRIAKMGKEDKFAVFVDDKLALVLAGQSVLDSGLTVSMTLNSNDIKKLTDQSANNKFYNLSLKYINLRIRSEGELRQYLKRKGADGEQINLVVDKLTGLDLINDDKFALAFIHDRTLNTPASKRKITYELRKKQIAEEVIEKSLSNDQISDMDSLLKMIEIKRRQTKFKDDLKLMQYLVRIGFNYSDVKDALKQSETN